MLPSDSASDANSLKYIPLDLPKSSSSSLSGWSSSNENNASAEPLKRTLQKEYWRTFYFLP